MQIFEDERDKKMIDRENRLRRIRNRLLGQSALGLACNSLLYIALYFILGSSVLDRWMEIACVFFLLIVLPGMILMQTNWINAKLAVSDMWAFGQSSFEEISRELAAHKAIGDEIKDSKPYIDVMHDQIGDSLNESERAVMQVIEQIGKLNANSVLQREEIAQSIQSGRQLTDSTNLRVESNKQIIAAIEAQLWAQNMELQEDFNRVQEMAKKVRALTDLVKVITSIAQQTHLLALNAEIEAARAGEAGRGFSVVAHEVRKLAESSTKAASAISEQIHSTCEQVDKETSAAQESLKKHQTSDVMVNLIADLANMQNEFARNSKLLLDVITGVDANYAESVNRLTEALGHIQFQDVMRQRMEHVQEALVEMSNHLMHLIEKQDCCGPDEQFDSSFKSMLTAHLDRYRMASQTQTHLAVSGEESNQDHSRPAIELF